MHSSELRVNIARRRRWDVMFSLIGLAALAFGLLVFLTLFVDMVIDGYATQPRVLY